MQLRKKMEGNKMNLLHGVVQRNLNMTTNCMMSCIVLTPCI